MLPYRYAMPAALLEKLSSVIQIEPATKKQVTILGMLETLWKAEKLALTGFSPTEALTVLSAAIVTRTQLSPTDFLLVPLVRCVSALGTNVYYVGQADDMVEELIVRISELQQQGPRLQRSRSRNASVASGVVTPVTLTPASPNDTEAIRILIACMSNILLRNSDMGDPHDLNSTSSRNTDEIALKGKGPVTGDVRPATGRRGRRNPVSPEVWQETLPLLCEAKFAVRAEYAKSLILYLRQELPAYQAGENIDGLQDVNLSVSRFGHALSATLYSLAISSRLGYAGPALTAESLGIHHREDGLTALAGPRVVVQTPTPGLSTPKGSFTTDDPPAMTRRTSKLVSLPFHRHGSSSEGHMSSVSSGTVAEEVAGPVDYLLIREVLNELLNIGSRIALIVVAPMLFALDRDAGSVLVRKPNDTRDNIFIHERRKACREVICWIWQRIAAKWDLRGLSESISKVSGDSPPTKTVH
jgi:hypothetical protein